jgi:hypothetical protein
MMVSLKCCNAESLNSNQIIGSHIVTSGRQPQYMRDNPDGYLFVDVKDCCKARESTGALKMILFFILKDPNVRCFLCEDFPWDETCGRLSPNGIWFYPKYDEATCYEKPLSEFDKYSTEKYVNKNICCMEKFSNDVMTCCDSGSGECTATGKPVFLPNWQKQKCEERDSTLVTEWEADWVSNTVEECCQECKYCAGIYYYLLTVSG